jgi:TonB family protein
MAALHWRNAITASVCLHILLLAATGYLINLKAPTAIKGKIFLDVEVISDSVNKDGNASGQPEQAMSSATPETGKSHSAGGSQTPDLRRDVVKPVKPSEAKRPHSSEPVVASAAVDRDEILKADPKPVTFSETKTPHSSESVVKNIAVAPDKIAEADPKPVTPGEVISPPSNETVAKNTAVAPDKTAKAARGSHTAVVGRRMGGSDDTASGVNGSPGTGGSELAGGNFVRNGDGTYTALSPAGIDYAIIRSVEANYPEEARAVGYARLIRVKAEILVGLKGNVESVSILNNVPNLGFREAVRQALMRWKFSPIYYRGINIKMKFYKNFYFEPS